MSEKPHPYTDGDLVYDLKHREVFTFSEEYDGVLARAFPERLRVATEDERVAYLRKQENAPLQHQTKD